MQALDGLFPSAEITADPEASATVCAVIEALVTHRPQDPAFKALLAAQAGKLPSFAARAELHKPRQPVRLIGWRARRTGVNRSPSSPSTAAQTIAGLEGF